MSGRDMSGLHSSNPLFFEQVVFPINLTELVQSRMLANKLLLSCIYNAISRWRASCVEVDG